MNVYRFVGAAVLCLMTTLGGPSPSAANADRPALGREALVDVGANAVGWPACLQRTFAVGEIVDLASSIQFNPGIGRLNAADREPLAAGSQVRVERKRSTEALLVRPVGEERDHLVFSVWRGDLAAAVCGPGGDDIDRWWALRLCPVWPLLDWRPGERLQLSWPVMFSRPGNAKVVGELYRGDRLVVVGPAHREFGDAVQLRIGSSKSPSSPWRGGLVEIAVDELRGAVTCNAPPQPWADQGITSPGQSRETGR